MVDIARKKYRRTSKSPHINNLPDTMFADVAKCLWRLSQVIFTVAMNPTPPFAIGVSPLGICHQYFVIWGLPLGFAIRVLPSGFRYQGVTIKVLPLVPG